MTAEPWQAHIDGEILEAYAMGSLSEEACSPVEDHLLLCVACQERLSALDEFVAAFRELDLPEDSPSPAAAPQRMAR